MNPNFETSALYVMDNLDMMRGMDTETVDLIYLDPPFNSKRMYQGMSGSRVQAHRFRDTWSWTDAKQEWLDLLENEYPDLHRLVYLGKTHSGGMGGYLGFMAPRVIEMHRILKPTGSLYLHCDPHADSYLRILLDLVFSSKNRNNNVGWLRRQEKHNLASRRMPSTHDTIMWFTKSENYVYNIQYADHDPDYIAKNYKYKDSQGIYATFPCTNATGGNKAYEFRGITAQWRFSMERMTEMYKQGLLVQTKPGSAFRYKKYLSDSQGVKVTDMWLDIPATRGKERTGWNTQKPLALLERIIKASSNEGDIVFDPFAGCGTAMVAAERLGRKWVGGDSDRNAVGVVQERLASLQGEVADKPQLQLPVSIIWDAPDRTEVVDEKGIIRDPTGYIIPKKPSDKMSTAAIRAKLLEWQLEANGNVLCLGCGEYLKARHFHVDHIDPKSQGGSNRIDNRILLCGACNGEKGNSETLLALMTRYIKGRKERKAMQDRLLEIRKLARAFVEELDREYVPPMI